MTQEIPTLEIDMDKECERCGEKGTTKRGICLKCVADSIKKNQAIGYAVLQRAKAELCAMLDEYAEEIDKAYIQADNELTISLSVKLSPTKLAGEIAMVVGIKFTESKIDHKIKVIVNERQMSLQGM